VNELRSIFDAMDQLRHLNAPAVLATVVSVEGSTYRRPGARMLVTPAGSRIGSVSGGCLESDVARKAWQLTAGGEGGDSHVRFDVGGRRALGTWIGMQRPHWHSG